MNQFTCQHQHDKFGMMVSCQLDGSLQAIIPIVLYLYLDTGQLSSFFAHERLLRQH